MQQNGTDVQVCAVLPSGSHSILNSNLSRSGTTFKAKHMTNSWRPHVIFPPHHRCLAHLYLLEAEVLQGSNGTHAEPQHLQHVRRLAPPGLHMVHQHLAALDRPVLPPLIELYSEEGGAPGVVCREAVEPGGDEGGRPGVEGGAPGGWGRRGQLLLVDLALGGHVPDVEDGVGVQRAEVGGAAPGGEVDDRGGWRPARNDTCDPFLTGEKGTPVCKVPEVLCASHRRLYQP